MEQIATPLTVEQTGTFFDIGARYTIGGRAYGPALAYYNGYADPETILQPGDVIEIPENWLGIAVTGTTQQAPAQTQPQTDKLTLLGLLAVGLLVLAK